MAKASLKVTGIGSIVWGVMLATAGVYAIQSKGFDIRVFLFFLVGGLGVFLLGVRNLVKPTRSWLVLNAVILLGYGGFVFFVSTIANPSPRFLGPVFQLLGLILIGLALLSGSPQTSEVKQPSTPQGQARNVVPRRGERPVWAKTMLVILGMGAVSLTVLAIKDPIAEHNRTGDLLRGPNRVSGEGTITIYGKHGTITIPYDGSTGDRRTFGEKLRDFWILTDKTLVVLVGVLLVLGVLIVVGSRKPGQEGLRDVRTK